MQHIQEEATYKHDFSAQMAKAIKNSERMPMFDMMEDIGNYDEAYYDPVVNVPVEEKNEFIDRSPIKT